MHRAEFHQHVGEENVCANIQEALNRAEQIAGELGLGSPEMRRLGEAELTKPETGA